MLKQEADSRIYALREELEKHRVAYHVHDSPVISDEVYDSLMAELISLERDHPELAHDLSPSVRVGGDILVKFQKVKHEYRQWSFDNVFNFEELSDWQERNINYLKKENASDVLIDLSNIRYVCEMKIDGLKVVLTYKDGKLMRGATRGDGEVGEDITENIKTIKSVPLVIKEQASITVIGECWLEKSELIKINKLQADEGLSAYANTRNLAAGTLRQLDPKVVAKRKLKIFAYDVETDSGEVLNKINTQEKELDYLEGLGFLVNRVRRVCDSVVEVERYYKSLIKKKDSYEYGVDGLVVKTNSRELWSALGYTAKSPRAGIAYKFPAEITTTMLEDVIFQVGRTGVITPVAQLTPVFLSGSLVSRATLHNKEEIERLGIKIGDTVMLRKAGDVIPEVYEVMPSLRVDKLSRDIIFPEICPACDSPLIRKVNEKKEGVKFYCDNSNCAAKHAQRMIHFVSKKGMNIEGLGDKIVEEFLSLGLIHSYTSLYKLKVKDIEQLPGYGEKSAINIVESIEKSRVTELRSLLFALGIDAVGESTAKDLAKNFPSLTEIITAKEEELVNLKDMGPVTASSIYNYFNQAENKLELENLLKEIVVVNNSYKNKTQKNQELQGPNHHEGEEKLAGLVFVLTGTLSKSRDYYKDFIEGLGGKVSGSVSSKTDYLLCGDNAGSKLKEAESLGVKIIGEEELFML